MPVTSFLLAVFAITNIFAFFVMANDKRKSAASGNPDRTPEGILFFLATAFGSIGIYLAMIIFRHKTRKWYFQIGIPLLIIQNTVSIYLLWQYITVNE
jgi:uncharacterized membrane protein YsdA (DUF1294 family)